MSIVVGGVYRPVPPDQINDRDPVYGRVGCTAYSVAAVDERNVLGLNPIRGWDLTAYLKPTARGLTLGEALLGLERVAGRTLERRTVDREGLWEAVAEGRAAVVQGDADQLDPCGHNFRGGHAVALNDARTVVNGREYLVGDPLCDKWLWMPEAKVVAYATKLWGPMIPIAISRALRVPHVSVRGAFFRYHVEGGVIAKRTRHRTGGFSADTSVPRVVTWPAQRTTRTLVHVWTGAFAGWWIEPLASNVHYAGEVE